MHQGRRSDFYSRRDCAGISPACTPIKPLVIQGHPSYSIQFGDMVSRYQKKVNSFAWLL